MHRQRLTERGGLRLGDRVRILNNGNTAYRWAEGPDPHSTGYITEVHWAAPRDGQHTEPATIHFEHFTAHTDPQDTEFHDMALRVSHGQDHEATELDLLLLDENDNRALPHALLCAASDLATSGYPFADPLPAHVVPITSTTPAHI